MRHLSDQQIRSVLLYILDSSPELRHKGVSLGFSRVAREAGISYLTLRKIARGEETFWQSRTAVSEALCRLSAMMGDRAPPPLTSAVASLAAPQQTRAAPQQAPGESAPPPTTHYVRFR